MKSSTPRTKILGGEPYPLQSRKRTLVLEDDEDLRFLLVEAMSHAGYMPVGIATIEEFESEAAKQHWDLAIIDVNLPDGSGYAVARRLRRECDTRIIILTGRSALADRLESHAAGGDAHITKPPQLAEILAVADTLLSRRDETAFEKPVWRLDDRSRLLTTPSGRSFKLAPREYALIQRLMETPDRLVSNEEAMVVTSFGGEITSLHALRMLLSRLRQRCLKATGEELPVETVIGRGLLFKDL